MNNDNELQRVKSFKSVIFILIAERTKQIYRLYLFIFFTCYWLIAVSRYYLVPEVRTR